MNPNSWGSVKQKGLVNKISCHDMLLNVSKSYKQVLYRRHVNRTEPPAHCGREDNGVEKADELLEKAGEDGRWRQAPGESGIAAAEV